MQWEKRNLWELSFCIKPCIRVFIYTTSCNCRDCNIHGQRIISHLAQRRSIHKNSITLFLGELLFRSIKEGAYEEGLYDWCVSRILTLDSMPGNFANFHLLFLLELASALGFSPSVEDILPFAEENASKIPLLLQAPVEEFMLVPLSGRERSEIADSLLRYLSYHLEYPLNIKSLRVLSELYR